MSQYRAYFVPGGMDPSGLYVGDPDVPWDHHWFCQKKSTEDLFNSKCGDLLEKLYSNYTHFRNRFTTRFEPGWGEYSMHTWIENQHPDGKYGERVDEILKNSKNCCEALKEIKNLIYQYYTDAWYGPNFVESVKIPLHPYRGNPTHDTSGFLDQVIDIACNSIPPPPRFVPVEEPIPRPVPVPDLEPPVGIPVVPPKLFPIPQPAPAPTPPWWQRWPKLPPIRLSIPPLFIPELWDPNFGASPGHNIA